MMLSITDFVVYLTEFQMKLMSTVAQKIKLKIIYFTTQTMIFRMNHQMQKQIVFHLKPELDFEKLVLSETNENLTSYIAPNI